MNEDQVNKQLNSFKLEIDPLNKYSETRQDHIIESLGLIPQFVNNPMYVDKSLKETLDLSYGFGLHKMYGGKVEEDGRFTYPEDPDLYPLAKMIRGNEYLYQYPHAIIAIWCADTESYFVTRMD